jgi:hypothetical protein
VVWNEIFDAKFFLKHEFVGMELFGELFGDGVV